MGAQRTSFEKLQRDRNKKAKQALKRERRQTGETRIGEDGEEILVELSTEGELSAAELLARPLFQDLRGSATPFWDGHSDVFPVGTKVQVYGRVVGWRGKVSFGDEKKRVGILC